MKQMKDERWKMKEAAVEIPSLTDLDCLESSNSIGIHLYIKFWWMQEPMKQVCENDTFWPSLDMSTHSRDDLYYEM